MGHLQPAAHSRQPSALSHRPSAPSLHFARAVAAYALVLGLLVSGQLVAQARAPSTQRPAPSTSKLPPVPRVTGPLNIQVVYPGPTDIVDAGDSNFVFGQ